MENAQTENSAAGGLSDLTDVERCGLCRKWHKSKHYDCQHNGPWGGVAQSKRQNLTRAFITCRMTVYTH